MAKVSRTEFILGGQRSGKSRRAENLAQAWLAKSLGNRALMLATAQAWDAEMQERIARHQSDRAQRVPGMRTIEEPRYLAEAIQQNSQADLLIVVDCLTLWLTRLTMPLDPLDALDEAALLDATQALTEAIANAPGPVVLVGNEIGMGVIPMGLEVRQFVDALGRLNQSVAAVCDRVTLMVAGLPLTLKAAV